jgi:hypothetical protein
VSIWRYVFDNEFMQRADIERLRARERSLSRSQRRRSSATNKRIEALEDEVGELTLLCRTLLTTLRESGHIDPAAFEAVMERIDLADGVADGQLRIEREEPEPEAPVRRRRRRT